MSFSTVLAVFTISAIPSNMNMAKFLAIETVYSWFVIMLALVAFIEDAYVFTKGSLDMYLLYKLCKLLAVAFWSDWSDIF